jgi:hypothetical protein
MNTQQQSSMLTEFVVKLSNDDLTKVGFQFLENLTGDLAEVITMVQSNNIADQVFRSARSVDEFYERIDLLSTLVKKELNRRSLILER